MTKCPVCEKENSGLTCRNCGFDGSCNYERYPSLGNLPPATESVKARRAALTEQEKNVIHCPFCGSTSLAVEVTLQCTCNDCKQRFSLVFAQDDPVPPTPPVEPIEEAPKRTRGKMETWVLCMAYINGLFCVAIIAWNVLGALLPKLISPPPGRDWVFVAISLVLLLIQVRFKRKGFTRSPALKKIWNLSRSLFDRPVSRNIFLMLPQILFSSFGGVFCGFIINTPVNILIFYGYGMPLLLPMFLWKYATGDMDAGMYSGTGFVLMLLWMVTSFHFLGVWLHGNVRELKK